MKTVVRILLAAVAYVIGSVLTGIIAPVLHLSSFRVAENIAPEKLFLALVLSSPLLAIGVAPLAAGLRGSFMKRFAAIAALLYVAIGLNTAIEAKKFTTLIAGSAFGVSLQSLLPCLFAAAVLATIHTEPSASPAMLRFDGAWTWRLPVAWLSFPVIYWVFGMCVAPFVIKYYDAGALGLRIPAPSTILLTQLLRSALFLAASLPAIWLWRKSRRQFILAMGLAHAFAVGIFQLAGATFLPVVLRVAHSIEITADSFAYAAVLGLLFIAKGSAVSVAALEKAEVNRPVAV